MNELTLKLPYPPTVNHSKTIGRTVTTRTGKRLQYRVNSDATNIFYSLVATIIAQQTVRFADAAIRLEVWVSLHPPNKRRSDIDNRIKILLDSLQRGGLIANDYQIARLIVERKGIITGGAVIVTIKII